MNKLHAFLAAGLLLCAGFETSAQNQQQPTQRLVGKLANSTILPLAENNQPNATPGTIRVPQTEIEHAWSEENGWVPLYERTYEYNNKGWRTQQLTKDLTENELLNLALHNYDAQGRDTLLVMQVPLNEGWVNSHRSRTKYDAQGHVVYSATFSWAQEAWLLQNATRFNYTYGLDHRVEEVITQQYANNQWTDFRKEEFSYHGNSTFPFRKTIYTGTESAWSPVQRYTDIAYNDENQREHSYVLQTWNATDWQNVSHHSFTYSTNMTTFATISVEEVRRYRGANIVLEEKITEEYLPSGQFMQYKVELLTDGQWLVDTENSLIGHGIIEPEGGGFTEFIYQTFSYNTQGQLRYDNLLKHTFSDFINITVTSAAEEIPASAVTVYPNPAKDMLHIALDAATIKEASVSIHNLTGQKVYELVGLRGEAAINLNHLPGGIYLVSVKGVNNAGVTKKIVKQ